MRPIKINRALFKTLKDDYNSYKDKNDKQSILRAGMDYMEAMIKLYSVISFSMLKDIDNEKAKKLITNQHTFSSQPSLGHYYKLLTRNEKGLNSILDIINDILDEKKDIEILDIVSINADEIVYKKCTTLRSVLDYSVSFRNKIAHGASFGCDDKQSDKTLEILDDIITNLEIVYNIVDTNIEFCHEDMKVFISDKNKEDGKFYELVPLVLYIECDKYICHDNHRTKLFFLNEAKPNQSYFLDYSLNHYFLSDKNHDAYQLLQKENKKPKQKKSIYTKHLAYSPTNTNMEQDLVLNFVGRDDELNQCIEHIKSSKKNNKASFINIVGKPGIGKSSFVTLLKIKLLEDTELNEKMNSFIYYFSKDNLGSKDEEYKNFYNKLKEYIPKNPNDKDSTTNNEFDFTKDMEKLVVGYEKHQSKPLLLIIDGIDELSHPLDFIRNFSIKFSTKIHLIFTFRDYKYLKDIIRTKFESSCSRINILNQNSVLEKGYSIELGKLSQDKVEELLYKVIPKDIKDNEQYNKIVQTIYERSEGLPLYIHYICEELKNNVANIHNDIAKNIIKWADKLPPDIAGFYTKRFEQLDKPMQREILLLIFYSKTPLDTMTISSLLKYVSNSYDNSIDEGIFEKDYFNHIEIFLKSNKLGEYSFYHNSVREALFEYLKKKNHIYTFNHDKLDGLLVTADIEENSSIIDDFYYMIDSSSTYKFLNNLVHFLKDNEKENNTIEEYYNKNFLHLYNRLIYIHILQQKECITQKDMKIVNYESLKEFQIKNKNEIFDFFKILKNKKNKNIYEIYYAYKLAFLIEDYSKIIKYCYNYKNALIYEFVDVIYSLNHEKSREWFLEHKNIWNRILDDNLKYEILNSTIVKLHSKESFEIISTITNSAMRNKAYAILSNENKDIKTSLKALSLIKNDSIKLEIILSLIDNTDNLEILNKIFNITQREFENWKSGYFHKKIYIKLCEKSIDNLLINKIIFSIEKFTIAMNQIEVLINIEKRTSSYNKLIESKINDLYDSESNTIVLQSIKQEISLLRNNKYKSYLLKDDIGSKLLNKDNFITMLEDSLFQNEIKSKIKNFILIFHNFPNNEYDKYFISFFNSFEKESQQIIILKEFLEEIVINLSCLNKQNNTIKILCNIIKYINQKLFFKAKNLLFIKKIKVNKLIDYILNNPTDKKLYKKAIQLVKDKKITTYNNHDSHCLASEKLKNVNEIKKVLKDTEKISCVFEKGFALYEIVKKITDTNQALKVANTIEEEACRSLALSSIAQSTNSMMEALAITEQIEFSTIPNTIIGKVEALLYIMEKTDDLKFHDKINFLLDHLVDNEYRNRLIFETKIVVDKITQKKNQKIYFNKVKNDLELSQKINNKTLFKESIEIIKEKLNEDDRKALFLFFIKKSTNVLFFDWIVCELDSLNNSIKLEIIIKILDNDQLDINLYINILNVIKKFEVDSYKEKVLLIVLNQIIFNENIFNEMIDIIYNIENDNTKKLLLLKILKRINNINNVKLYQNILQAAMSLKLDSLRSETVLVIFEQIKFKNKVLSAIYSVSKYKEKVNLLFIINNKRKKYFNNILYQVVVSQNYFTDESINLIIEIEHRYLLNYFELNNKTNYFINPFMNALNQINLLIDEDEQYKKLEDLKKEIIKDDLLEAFIKQYGELLGISNKSEFRQKLQIEKLDLILSQ